MSTNIHSATFNWAHSCQSFTGNLLPLKNPSLFRRLEARALGAILMPIVHMVTTIALILLGSMKIIVGATITPIRKTWAWVNKNPIQTEWTLLKGLSHLNEAGVHLCNIPISFILNLIIPRHQNNLEKLLEVLEQNKSHSAKNRSNAAQKQRDGLKNLPQNIAQQVNPPTSDLVQNLQMEIAHLEKEQGQLKKIHFDLNQKKQASNIQSSDSPLPSSKPAVALKKSPQKNPPLLPSKLLTKKINSPTPSIKVKKAPLTAVQKIFAHTARSDLERQLRFQKKRLMLAENRFDEKISLKLGRIFGLNQFSSEYQELVKRASPDTLMPGVPPIYLDEAQTKIILDFLNNDYLILKQVLAPTNEAEENLWLVYLYVTYQTFTELKEGERKGAFRTYPWQRPSTTGSDTLEQILLRAFNSLNGEGTHATQEEMNKIFGCIKKVVSRLQMNHFKYDSSQRNKARQKKITPTPKEDEWETIDPRTRTTALAMIEKNKIAASKPAVGASKKNEHAQSISRRFGEEPNDNCLAVAAKLLQLVRGKRYLENRENLKLEN